MEFLQLRELLAQEALAAKKCAFHAAAATDRPLQALFTAGADLHRENLTGLLQELRHLDGRQPEGEPPAPRQTDPPAPGANHRGQSDMQSNELFSDRDRALDILLQEKSLAAAYFVAERESASQTLRRALHRMQEKVAEQHGRVFHAMHERGWYQTPVAGQQAIEQEIIQWEQRQAATPGLQR